ncbi:MAG: ribulose-phosphate 3-epimerase [Chloroflexi bacterium]|nr:ribulose-phosphate 3-epimerase [Chloroflexota bacterium]
MNPCMLAPSIIASDMGRLAEEIAMCEAAGAHWLHVDVMDGHFVPTISVGPLFVEACKRSTRLPLDVHLMLEHPQDHIESFARAGANNLTIHIEACENPLRTIERIHSLGCTAGITLKPATPAASLEPVLPLVDLVLVMSVEPGYSGQKFMEGMIGKVREMRGRLDSLGSRAHLEVDGSINVETLPRMKEAGANIFVAGSAVFKHKEGTEAGVKSLLAQLD